MKQYFVARCKQLARYLPGMFLAMLVLLFSLFGIYSLLMEQDAQSDDKQKFQIAVVGNTDEPFLQTGLTTLQAFDSTRFAMDIRQMTRDEAETALARGQIAAYVVVPPEFVEEAMRGNILPLEFVSTTGSTGLVSIFKDEVTQVISGILLDSQKGVYGMADAAVDEGVNPGKHMDNMAISYAQQVFTREQVYMLENLGIAHRLSLSEYLLCGFSVVLILLCCLPFAPAMIHRDLSLSKMLVARGRSPGGLSCSEYGSFFLMLFLPVLTVLAAISIWMNTNLILLVFRLLPVVLMASAFSFMLYSLSSDLIGGVLLQFFTALGLCFVSGCLYPVYFFPTQVQKFAAWLPAGIAQKHLSGFFTGTFHLTTVGLLLGYSVLFVTIGMLSATRKIREVRL